MNPTILITGANGQLGAEIKELENLYKHFSITYTDIDTLDISDVKVLRDYTSSMHFDYFVNCAAYTAVDKAESEADAAFKINAQAVNNLVQVASKNQVRFIHISTDYVFDGKNYKPYSENDMPNPQSIYGTSKLRGEDEALKYEHAIIIRTSWLYSSYGNNFVKTILRMGKEKNEIKVVSDQAGTPTYANDLAKAILEIIDKTSKNPDDYIAGIFHFSNEGICSWYDFALEIINKAALNCMVIPVESTEYRTPAKRPFYSVLNKKKIKETYHLHVPHWKDSLYQCLQKMRIK